MQTWIIIVRRINLIIRLFFHYAENFKIACRQKNTYTFLAWWFAILPGFTVSYFIMVCFAGRSYSWRDIREGFLPLGLSVGSYDGVYDGIEPGRETQGNVPIPQNRMPDCMDFRLAE